ncbi:sensor histidine kinase [Peptoniphilus sp. HMSC062D09]|uniref:sensor histidine kinase n=1 Tax=Peptoniphilus sp. HMSC062D09 TaxID=1739305 RepID=UPI0008A449CF|nr:sensor histidine kinase [Peptoniphilus sp. HMSC062D09]OFK79381.1 histidine kinase [Peptoniphilus sp. HMSC062D09]
MSHLPIKSFLKREKFTIIFGIFIFFYILGVYLVFEFERVKTIYISFLYLFLFFIYMVFLYSTRDREFREEIALLNQKNYEKILEIKDSPLSRALYKSVEENKKFRNSEEKRRSDVKNYLTIWTHQIKSPIFALRLLLKKDEINKIECEKEIFEIEEYVGNILGYARLNADSTDYVFSKYSLDEIIRGVIRKYSIQFIGKNNSLDFCETKKIILTDAKWFSFLLEQIISNAIKYTQNGRVAIYLKKDELVIEDNGIGIMPEDLPRIFDAGYTGYNGRLEKKSTGLGLTLSKNIGKSLRVTLRCESEPKIGTKMYINLKNILD